LPGEAALASVLTAAYAPPEERTEAATDRRQSGGRGRLLMLWAIPAVLLLTAGVLLALPGLWPALRTDDRNDPVRAGGDDTQVPKGRPHVNSVGMTFVRIEPGSFLMGSPDGINPPGVSKEAERSADETLHKVTLTRGYRMSATLVTQYQWEQVLGGETANHCIFKGKDEAEKKTLPVDNVSWYECVDFCNELSKKEKKTPCYGLANVQRDPAGRITLADVTLLPDGTGYRLPTEAEWEYAARAGTTTPFWCGDTISADQANYDSAVAYGPSGKKGAPLRKTTPVNRFPANPWGLYDMGGNLYQWCQDWYGPYEGGNVNDPVQLQKADKGARVLRGGCWASSPGLCRAACRYENAPVSRHQSRGCRVVLCLD
jgi:formylglycine-generating enzyme required for sulfatase activity